MNSQEDSIKVSEIRERLLHSKDEAKEGRQSSEVSENEKLLSPMGTFIVLIKGYACLTLLLVPKAYVNGGYLFSPMC
jgi:hypothetical protein